MHFDVGRHWWWVFNDIAKLYMSQNIKTKTCLYQHKSYIFNRNLGLGDYKANTDIAFCSHPLLSSVYRVTGSFQALSWWILPQVIRLQRTRFISGITSSVTMGVWNVNENQYVCMQGKSLIGICLKCIGIYGICMYLALNANEDKKNYCEVYKCWWRNINWSNVQWQNVVNNVDMSSIRAPWKNGPYKNKKVSMHLKSRLETTVNTMSIHVINKEMYLQYNKHNFCVFVRKCKTHD